MRRDHLVRRTIAATVLSFSVALATPAVATAAPTYPAPAASATVSPSTVKPGKVVTFSARGFAPSETITVTQQYTNWRATTVTTKRAGAGGTIKLTVAFKKLGTVKLYAKGARKGRSVSATVRVVK
jgi:hypothetical protein